MSLTNKAKALFSLLKTDPIKDTHELLAVCQECAKDQLKRDAATIQRDAELQIVKDYHDAGIETLNSKIEHQVKRLRAWAVEHREKMFGKKQSFILAGHELAFQKSPGAVGFAEGVKAEDVVEAILNMEGEDGDTFRSLLLRVKAELEKKAALRELRLNLEGRAEKLEALGLRITSEETFSFTPARAELPEITEKAEGKEAA
jgi:hypothetical protein